VLTVDIGKVIDQVNDIARDIRSTLNRDSN
jgi:hypothetical protein